MEGLEFGLYKLLVHEVREARKARRQLANLFVTLNLAGASALGFLANSEGRLSPALATWLIVALVLTCLVWRMSNSYYTQMLAIKYEIIYELEQGLGVDALQREWKKLSQHGLMKWFGLERLMPVLFIVGYLIFLAYLITPEDIAAAIAAWDAWLERAGAFLQSAPAGNSSPE